MLKDAQQPAAPLPADKVDSTLFGNIGEKDLDRSRTPLPPPTLNVTPGLQDFDLRGDSKSLWEQVAARLHLSVLFDTQYQPTRLRPVSIGRRQLRNTLLALEAATDSFLIPVSERLIFVANDSPQKRTDFDTNVAVVIHFPRPFRCRSCRK